MKHGEGPLILSIDTATRSSSLSLSRGTIAEGTVIASLSLSSSITHSRRLIGGVDHLLRETDTTWDDIGGVAVGLGPGSFTGLRIGMATAKGFAVAAGIPLLGVSTLECLASSCISTKLICAVIDARKKQVYAGFYKWKGNELVQQGELLVVDPEQLAAMLIEPAVLVGDGAAAYGKLLEEKAQTELQQAPSHLHTPQAASIGLLCGSKWNNNDFLDTASAVPVYVRASDAELSLLDASRQKKSRSQA